MYMFNDNLLLSKCSDNLHQISEIVPPVDDWCEADLMWCCIDCITR